MGSARKSGEGETNPKDSAITKTKGKQTMASNSKSPRIRSTHTHTHTHTIVCTKKKREKTKARSHTRATSACTILLVHSTHSPNGEWNPPPKKKKKKIRHTLDRVQAHAASNEGDKNKKKEVSR